MEASVSGPAGAETAPSASSEPLFVVGVGASAGGLEALERFFEGIRPTGKHAFVVVQHLSPDFKSLMDELLSRHTSLAIHRAEDGMEVGPDAIYLLPPKKELLIADSRLVLRDRHTDQGLSLPIDAFFGALARDAGARAIAVVLSGTGTDGSRGVRAIHEAGGLVLAQSEESARFDGMPRAAIETGVVDLVLAPEELAAVVVRYGENGGHLEVDGEPGAPRDPMKRILELLRKETGVDFSGYKSTTVGRRIERRLVMSDTRDLGEYLSRIENDAVEVRSLYRDLLIGVTRFFRDPEAFAALRREVLPAALDRLGAGEELRVWVPACATGEEAFSIAILVHEALRTRGRAPALKLFATDIHRASLDVASAGSYPADAVVNVPPELRDRYFQRIGEAWQVSADLRSCIVFAQHNLLRDAPFTRLDLVSCRNFLIYLNAAPQHKVLTVFHYALKPHGTLLLGPSETTGALSDEFSCIDARWKIFRKRRDVRLAADLPLPTASGLGARVVRPRTGAEEDPRVKAAREALLQRHAPPTLLVDERFDLVHAFNGAGRFFVPRDGPPSSNVLDLLVGELKIVVSGALKRALKERRAVEFAAVNVPVGGGTERVSVSVEPLGPGAHVDAGLLVTLQPAVAQALPAAAADLGLLTSERVVALESELRQSQENLQATVEEMETSSEELQATNEELTASNEELQSTNEELHSVNEELYTVNAEYQAKIAELTELTSDMNHLLEATQVHTLFLDGSLRLRKFTPRMAELFNLLPQDLGRRIEGFAHGLDDDHLLADLGRVLESGDAVEREVRDRKGNALLLRILPYRSGTRVDGVVLTLVDIAAMKRAQERLQQSEERYRTLLRAIASVVWTADADGRFATPQPEWEDYTGQGWDGHRGEGWLDAIHPGDRAAVRDGWRAAVGRGQPFDAAGRLWSARHGAWRQFTLRAVPVREEGGAVREWVGNVVDVHDAWVRDADLHVRTAQLEGFLAHSPSFLWVKDLAGRYLFASRSAAAILGASGEAARGRTDHDLATAPVADALRASDQRVTESGGVAETEEELPFAGERRTFLSTRWALRDGAGAVVAVAGISTDISDRKRAADIDREAIGRRDWLLAMLSHELRTPLGAILNATDLLGNAELPDERRAAALAILRRQSRHMARLLDDLLDVARLAREQPVLRKQAVDLAAIVRDAAEAVRPAAEKKGLALRVETPAGEVPIVGEASRVQQILANLLGNSVKYTHGGAIHVHVAIEGREAKLHVRDTGVGMSPAQLARVFDLFYQAPQDLDRPLGGLGIGLHLAKRLAQLHGGDVSAASDGLGCGSEFVLTLPIAEGLATLPRRADSTTRPRLRVALVEDNEDIRETVQAILELAGHEVIVAGDGPTGAALIVEERPDVAVVDLGLPGCDGVEVARRVREQVGDDVALVALTGYGGADDRARARDAGFEAHLLKPVGSERLVEAIEAAAAHGGRARA